MRLRSWNDDRDVGEGKLTYREVGLIAEARALDDTLLEGHGLIVETLHEGGRGSAGQRLARELARGQAVCTSGQVRAGRGCHCVGCIGERHRHSARGGGACGCRRHGGGTGRAGRRGTGSAEQAD